jgi:hypothetical protein
LVAVKHSRLNGGDMVQERGRVEPPAALRHDGFGRPTATSRRYEDRYGNRTRRAGRNGVSFFTLFYKVNP